MDAIFGTGAMTTSKTKTFRNVIEDAWYRWQFLRRSQEYREDYAAFRQACPEWLDCGLDPSWPAEQAERNGEDPMNPPAGGFMLTAIARLRAFHERWGTDPIDPEDHGTPFIQGGRIWVMDEGPAHNWSADPDVLTLCINTAGPVKEIMAYLKWRVESHQQERRAGLGEPEKETRKRIAHYADYLKAHDLADQGMTDPQIAKELRLPDLRAASRYRQSARDLIDKAVRGDW